MTHILELRQDLGQSLLNQSIHEVDVMLSLVDPASQCLNEFVIIGYAFKEIVQDMLQVDLLAVIICVIGVSRFVRFRQFVDTLDDLFVFVLIE